MNKSELIELLETIAEIEPDNSMLRPDSNSRINLKDPPEGFSSTELDALEDSFKRLKFK